MEQQKEISVDDFKLYLDHGLPLNYDQFGGWVEKTLQWNYVDIGLLIYKRGRRLSKDKRDKALCSNIRFKVELFVERLALSASFDEAVELVYAGNIDPESVLSYMPKEIIYEMVFPLYGLYVEAATREL